MTRNHEIDAKDLTQCDHRAEVAVVNDAGRVEYWLCRCGQRAPTKLEDLAPGLDIGNGRRSCWRPRFREFPPLVKRCHDHDGCWVATETVHPRDGGGDFYIMNAHASSPDGALETWLDKAGRTCKFRKTFDGRLRFDESEVLERVEELVEAHASRRALEDDLASLPGPLSAEQIKGIRKLLERAQTLLAVGPEIVQMVRSDGHSHTGYRHGAECDYCDARSSALRKLAALLGVLTALVLIGCGAPPPTAPDAAAVETDAGAPDWFSARLACGLIGSFHERQRSAGLFDGCPDPEPCPFVYDPADSMRAECPPEVVEACLWALEGRGNDCERYREVIAECAASSERCTR